MAVNLYDSAARNGQGSNEQQGSSVASGTVVNNCDLAVQGKVLVRIPSISREVWARVTAVGAGSSRGFVFWPQPDDEVLVAFNQGDPNDAFILGGLWNNQDRVPESTPPQVMSRRSIRTGLVGGLGHEMTFDDATQAINIVTSTQQKITIDPVKIELTNMAGTLTITLDNSSQSITIQAAKAIKMKALEKISLESGQVEIKALGKADLKAGGICTIQGLTVKIN
ncbi:MAG: phage baseplate assembly protein V [Anaerolineae bacterium]